jgi:hypothetical protein
MFALTCSKRLVITALCAAAMAMIPVAAQAQDDDPPPEAGRISYISGNVSIQPVTSDEWGQAYPNLPVGPGDRIFTDSDGRAEIQVGQTYVRIGPNSDVTLVDDSQFNINFGVAQGSIRLHSFGLWPRQLVDISTPNGNAEFGNAGDLRIDVLPTDGATVFTNLGQFADITAAGDFRQELNYGQSLEIAGTNPVYPQWLQPNGPDDLDYWSQQRDQQLARAVSFQYVSPSIPGAADLDAYGDWQPATEYGAVWFPRSVPADWQPYHYGHWVDRDPWGWVWVEDEPWGYAPFHYGRWVVYGGRWGWVPGPVNVRPVWSPALVVFAGGGGGFHGGLSVWFPLGPGEAYRPWYRCSPRYIDQINITNIREAPRVHVEKTYVNIVNVTNVTNITYVNQTRVTAMRQDDFAAGRSVRNVAVQVDPRQIQQLRPLQRPDIQPTPRAIITRPVARPVPVSIQRPVLINQQGRQMAARPGATPVAPPVRPVAPVRAPVGRVVMATPPQGTQRPGNNQPPVQQGNQGNRDQRFNQPSQPGYGQTPRPNPVGSEPVNQRPNFPVNPNQPGNSPARQPGQNPGNYNDRQAGPQPVAPGVQPTGRPTPPPPSAQQPERPNYPQQRPNQPNDQRFNQPNQAQPQNPYSQQPQRPNQPYDQQPRPNQPQPQNPPEQYRQDFGPAQPDKHRNEAPPEPQGRPAQPPQQQPQFTPQERPNNQRQNEQPQNRPAPPPPNRSFDQPRPNQQPQPQSKPQSNGSKQNSDQKKDNKKDDKKHD